MLSYIQTHLTILSLSSIRDSLSTRTHSKDFIFARSEYLRTRIVVLAFVFMVLTPLWVMLDFLLIPKHNLHAVLIVRCLMFVGLVAAFLAARRRWKSVHINLLLSGVVLSLPAIFYAYILCTNDSHELIGYSFIPFLLVAALAMLPFTLIESFTLGCALVGLQFLAGHVTGDRFSPQALQDIWLLVALLSIALVTNHFQLSLLLRLYRQATHDALTNTLNRTALNRLIQSIELEKNPRPSAAILLIDLDHFKHINDTHGHSVGDEVLRRFGQLLKKHVPNHDAVYRYGGEEFLILLSPCKTEPTLELAERIRHECSYLTLHNLDQEPFRITISIGLSFLRMDETVEAAIQRADELLYTAKRNGRNRVEAETVTPAHNSSAA